MLKWNKCFYFCYIGRELCDYCYESEGSTLHLATSPKNELVFSKKQKQK